MSSTSSKSSRNRRSSILKVRQTVVESTVDVVQQQKNRRRVSFHHEKAVKEYDKERHELSATSPLKEAVKEAMSDFDSTKSNSTIMSLATPDRTAGDHTMNIFRGMLSGTQPSSSHHETRDMSFSFVEDAANTVGLNDTLNMFNGAKADHFTIHSKTVDISCTMEPISEDSMNETAAADNTMDIFGKASVNKSTRSAPNMTMDMDISKAETTLIPEEGGGNDTMAIFGSGSRKNDDTLVLDNTMGVFGGAGSGSSNRSLRVDQSVLMDISMIPTPASTQASQDNTMAVFGSGSQGDNSVAMEDETLVEEEREERVEVATPTPITASTPSTSTTLTHNQSIMMDESMTPTVLGNRSIGAKDRQSSPALEDTMAVFGSGETPEDDDEYDTAMDITQQSSKSSQQSQFPSQEATINIMRGGRSSDDMDMTAGGSVSPTINIFKRKGEMEEEEEEEEEEGVENTMHVFAVKKLREDGDAIVSSQVGSQGSHGAQEQEDMDEVDATMNVFGMKANSTLDESAMMMEEEKKEEEVNEKEKSIMEMSMKTAIEGEEGGEMKENTADTRSEMLNGTFDVFNGRGDESQMDVSAEANRTFEVKTNNISQMDVSGEAETMGVFGEKEREADETLGVFGRKEEEEEKGQEKEEEQGKKKEEQIVEQMAARPDEKESEDMEEENHPVPSQSYYEETKRKRLSTVIEVSSRYTAASSQSIRDRVESTGGILDGMEMTVDDNGGEEGDGQEEVKEEKEEEEEKEKEKEEEEKEKEKEEEEEVVKEEEQMMVETEEEKSIRMDESIVDSASPSGNNTTFSVSFSKRSMLDETRLSDRSMMNVTRSFGDMQLENIGWMKAGDGGAIEEIDQLIGMHAKKMVEETRPAIEKSESTVEEHLRSIAEEHGSLLATSISKLNPSKVAELQQLFDWARREAQRELWEKRGETADGLVREMERRMERDGRALEVAKDDLIMMNRLKQLGEDVSRLSAEVELGRGLSRSSIDELIGAAKRKEEEKERLRKEVMRMEMDSVTQSTNALRVMMERCAAVDRSIKEKMEERERTKKEMRAYLAQLTNNIS